MKVKNNIKALNTFLLISKNNPIVCFGKISRTHGVRGSVVVISFGDIISTLSSDSHIGLYSSNSPEYGFLINPQFIKNISVKVLFQKQNQIISQIQSDDLYYDSKETSAQLVGKYLGTPLRTLQEQYHFSKEPYLFHYMYLNVEEKKTKKNIGYISRIINETPQTLLVVFHQNLKKEIMVPLKSPFIDTIEIQKKKIVVSNIEDLIV